MTAVSARYAPRYAWPGGRGATARADDQLAAHLSAVVRRFGRPALGVIDLPPLAPAGELVSAQIRAAAVLLWCREVEQAELLAFVDALAEGLVDGRLILPITDAADRLMEYWRGRHDRFDAAERQALYDRLAGEGAGSVDAQLGALCHLLAEIGRLAAVANGGTQRLTVRVNLAGRELAAHLSDRGAGIAAFAAREIVAHIRAALALLHDPELTQALGSADVWSTIRLHAPTVLGRAIDPTPHLDRATASLTVLTWLADHAPMLERGAATVDPKAELVQAADAWEMTQ